MRLALLILCVACAAQSPSPATRTTIPRRDGYVHSGSGVQLFYRMVGSGRDTIVVLHGGPGFSLQYLADDLEPLALRHTVIFYDQRGTGRSTLVSDSTALDGQRFAEDLEALRTHFQLERLTLLVILGTEEFMTLESAREWTASLVNARLVQIAGSGHFPYLDTPEKFFAAVDAFLHP